MEYDKIPISELPFTFHGLEDQYGQINHAEAICPGVYYIATKFSSDRPRLGGEYLVVTEDSPAVSPEARAFTTPLPTIPRTFLCDYDYDCKGRHIVEYEAHKYLVAHDLPLQEYESLEEDRAFGMEVCPEYFGEFPIPEETPWGNVIRHDRIWNGLYWLETAQEGWVLAIAYPLYSVLFEDTLALAAQVDHDQEGKNYGYRFYTYRTSCRPLFEMLPYDEDTWGQKFDGAALQNALLENFPDYGLEDERNSPALPAEQRILPVPGVGTDFYLFP
ncbi:MAG: hypothetical protein KH704_11850 [Clostridiales bacterium]|nr:hypothetical protein [Clostridiales bacterium]